MGFYNCNTISNSFLKKKMTPNLLESNILYIITQRVSSIYGNDIYNDIYNDSIKVNVNWC
jgi:S-adenosylmethionine:diacylglycerol 3-amino-3-carboxypropyl transferase